MSTDERSYRYGSDHDRDRDIDREWDWGSDRNRGMDTNRGWRGFGWGNDQGRDNGWDRHNRRDRNRRVDKGGAIGPVDIENNPGTYHPSYLGGLGGALGTISPVDPTLNPGRFGSEPGGALGTISPVNPSVNPVPFQRPGSHGGALGPVDISVKAIYPSIPKRRWRGVRSGRY